MSKKSILHTIATEIVSKENFFLGAANTLLQKAHSLPSDTLTTAAVKVFYSGLFVGFVLLIAPTLMLEWLILILREKRATNAAKDVGSLRKRIDLTPPSTFWISMFLPADKAENCELSIEDAYSRWVSKYGERKAKWIFRGQVFGTIVSFHWTGIKAFAAIVCAACGWNALKEFFKPQ